MRRLLVLASLLALVATACKIETNFGFVINADGSGTVIAEIGMDDEAQELFLSDGTDPFEGEELAECPNARFSEERRGDLTFFVIECDVDDVTAFEEVATTTENSMLETFTISVTPTLVSVSGRASAEDSLGAEAEGFDPAVFEDSISANIRITLPGEILEHNADSRDGNTLIWEIPVLGGTLDIQASSDPTGTPSGSGGGGGFPVWLIAVIAVVALGAIYWFMTQRKRGSGTPPPAADTAPPAEEMPPPPPSE